MNRRGIIIFVVLGGIFVLTILILSYNHLVQGKFNENREILTHVRAMKTAQAVSRFIVEKLKADLKDVSSIEKNSPGNILRQTVFIENDAGRLSEKISSAWLEKINFTELTKTLFGSISTRDVSVSAEISFSDLILLNDMKKGNELFFDYEKAGKMKVQVEVLIGNTREEWVEVRPFRVVNPFPLPLTKFTLYLRESTTNLDPVKFNTVAVESAASGKVAAGSNRPIIIDNGFPSDNREDDVWMKRGWIHLGGGNLMLNRAAGNTGVGQRFHSYYNSQIPIALVLNFPDFTPLPVGSKNLEFRMARFGFSNSLLQDSFAAMWKSILAWNMKEHSPGKDKKWWGSGSLHLFGEAGGSPTDNKISITRVSGKVYDRFIELGYIFPTGEGEAPLGAVIGMGESDFDQTSGKKKKTLLKKIKDIPDSILADTWVDKKIIYLPGKIDGRLGVPDLREMEDFFEILPYSRQGLGVSYEKIMSRVHYCGYDETFKMISQYSKNSQNLNFPPKGTVPEIEDYKFKLEINGLKAAVPDIDKIVSDSDSLMGMDKRVCYEVKTSGKENLAALLKKNFCNPNNNDFRLGNAVLRVVSNGDGLVLADNLGAETGGMIMVDGPITVGTFRSAASAENAPLAILAEKGAITLKNNGQHPTLAYLIALEKGKGEIKTIAPDSPVSLIGGIAAHTLDPEQFQGGGNIFYNQALDPTSENFGRYLGVVIGPPGGQQ